ncbi:hypothetical protein Phou_076910 [Phytohabitans houttuyneae]|uniref:RsbT co-antagonist protein RsbRD N-terminal domain-containing protein n=1 Tax=Phytohabitans houttuyneae TaxID=1076126 RepID=A0A6V8KM54_9ACTN|nr:hypothetical protein Phou_076910 [Phytohabitans houttuyneae]
MGLDAAEGERFAAVLVRHEDQIVKRWTELVAETLRGRLSQAELGRQVTEIHRSLVAAAGPSGMSVDGEAAGELRAVLSELSVARARQGFTATETAVSIFALKDTLRDILDIRDSPELLSDYVEFSRLIDELGLFTFETYTKARESVVADQAEQLLELSTPVVKLWEGVVAVPLVGTLDSARAQVVMEKLLQTLVDTGSPTRSSTSPVCPPWTRRSRSTCSRRLSRPA